MALSLKLTIKLNKTDPNLKTNPSSNPKLTPILTLQLFYRTGILFFEHCPTGHDFQTSPYLLN